MRSLPTTTAEERRVILKDVEYNIFNFPAGLLTVDFLTDSGTSAMTDVQWAACENPLKIQISIARAPHPMADPTSDFRGSH